MGRARVAVPISGTQLRADIHMHRQFLDPTVSAHFVEHVVMLGAETTGKRTLALVESFGTTSAHEYGRDVYEREDGKLTHGHFLEIALGHRALKDEAARTPGLHRHVFCDTHAATTLMWSYRLIRIPSVLLTNQESADLPTSRPEPVLLPLASARISSFSQTIQDDLAHGQDGLRANTAVRSVQKGLIRQELGTRGIGFLEVRGSVAGRVEQVRAALKV